MTQSPTDAEPAQLQKGLKQRHLTMIAIGGVIGIVSAAWLSRFIESLLFGVTTGDVLTYVVAAATVLGASLIACYIPARAVLRIDPVVALRSE